jgi:hypothetical protein
VFHALTERGATLANNAVAAYSSLPSRGDRLVHLLCASACSGSSAGVVSISWARGALAVPRLGSAYSIQSARPPCSQHPGMARCHPHGRVGASSLYSRRCNPQAPSESAHAYSGSPVNVHDVPAGSASVTDRGHSRGRGKRRTGPAKSLQVAKAVAKEQVLSLLRK